MTPEDRATFGKRARNYISSVGDSVRAVRIGAADLEAIEALVRAELCAEMANDQSLVQEARERLKRLIRLEANPRIRKKKKRKKNPETVKRIVRQNARDLFRSVYKG